MGNAREIGNNLLNVIIYPLLSGFITIVFLISLFIITNKIDISSILLFLSIQNHKTLINLGLLLLITVSYLIGTLNIQMGEEISPSGRIPTNEAIKALDGDNWNKEFEENMKINDFIKAGINNNIWIIKSEYIFTTSRFFTSIFPAIFLSYLIFATYKIVVFLGEDNNLISLFLKLISSLNLKKIIILTIPIVIIIVIIITTKTNTKKFITKLPSKVKLFLKRKNSSGAKLLILFYYCGISFLLSKSPINITLTVFIISLIIATMSFAIGTKLREEANLFLKLGAKSNDYLYENGKGQHLCNPQDSSTKPQ